MSYRGFGLDTVSTAPKKSINEMTTEEQAEEGARQMVGFMMSCPGKAAISGVTGFGLGGVFGLFMASVRISTISLSQRWPFTNTILRWPTTCLLVMPPAISLISPSSSR